MVNHLIKPSGLCHLSPADLGETEARYSSKKSSILQQRRKKTKDLNKKNLMTKNPLSCLWRSDMMAMAWCLMVGASCSWKELWNVQYDEPWASLNVLYWGRHLLQGGVVGIPAYHRQSDILGQLQEILTCHSLPADKRNLFYYILLSKSWFLWSFSGNKSVNYDYLYIEVLSLGLLKLKKYKLRIYKIKVGKVTLGKEATNMYRGEYELNKVKQSFYEFYWTIKDV